MQSSMLTTNEFIRRKCSKDHLNSSGANHKKHSSVYAIDYKKGKKLEIYQKNKDVGRQRNTSSQDKSQYLLPPTSVYRNNFENINTQQVVKHHQKPSYFLKNQNYQPLQSTYHRASILKQDDFNSKQLKGKPQMDHLSIAKYNKMTTKTNYRQSFSEITKFPSIYEKQKTDKTLNKFSSFHESQVEKIANIR